MDIPSGAGMAAHMSFEIGHRSPDTQDSLKLACAADRRTDEGACPRRCGQFGARPASAQPESTTGQLVMQFCDVAMKLAGKGCCAARRLAGRDFVQLTGGDPRRCSAVELAGTPSIALILLLRDVP